MSYESESGTKLLATHCLICGRALRDPESIERGIGPICNEKHFAPGAGTQSADEDALEDALNRAPADLNNAFVRGYKRGSFRGGISSAIHLTGNKWEARAPETRKYLASFVEIADAAGFPTMAAAIVKRLSEKKLDKELPPAFESVKKFDRVRLKSGEAGEVFWAGERYGKPAFGLKTSPSAEPTWFKLKDIEAVEEPAETVSVSDFKPSDIKPPCKVELRDGSIRDVMKTGESRRGFWIGLKKLDGGRGYDFANLDDIVEIIYEEKEDAPEHSSGIQPKDIVAPCRVELRDGSIRNVKKTGESRRGFWIGAEKLDGGNKFDFLNIEDVVAVLPPLATKAAPKTRALKSRQLKLDDRLFKHQVEGAKWLAKRSGAILADDMGLGKTATSIFAMSTPAVVICPASLKTNWAREIEGWRPELSVSVVEGKKTDYTADVVICNFERVTGAVLDALMARENLTVIVDEAHALKNLRVSYRNGEPKLSGSRRAQNVWKLISYGGPGETRVDHAFLLTGTPMPNGRHEELFPLLNMADGGQTEEFKNFYSFCDQFCPPQEIPGPTQAKSYAENENAEELRDMIEPILIRRTKELLDLPPKFRQQKLIDLDAKCEKEYRAAVRDFKAWIKSVGGVKALDAALRAEALVKMTKLREIAAIGKIPGLTEEITDYLKGSERPLVVMAHHKKVINALYKSLTEAGWRVGRIDGSVPTNKRQAVVDAFQTGKLDVVLCSIKAAGVGLTLTSADTLFFAERDWRPFDLRQAEDRIHRIGQKNAATIVYYDAPNTIDEALSEVIDAKIAAANMVLGDNEEDTDESTESLAGQVLAAL
jgi:SWI/SNF-related matrix-associated actin-dependent regulator 1 of chromatin subfamily A